MNHKRITHTGKPYLILWYSVINKESQSFFAKTFLQLAGNFLHSNATIFGWIYQWSCPCNSEHRKYNQIKQGERVSGRPENGIYFFLFHFFSAVQKTLLSQKEPHIHALVSGLFTTHNRLRRVRVNALAAQLYENKGFQFIPSARVYVVKGVVPFMEIRAGPWVLVQNADAEHYISLTVFSHDIH